MKSFTRLGIFFLSTLLLCLSLFNGGFAQALTNPTIASKYSGINDPSTSPPSTSIAASPSEQMQLVNNKFAILNKATVISSGTTNSLVNTYGTFISDPQVMWDPNTNRFYFSVFENKGYSTPNEGIAWGFSKTAKPQSAADFCTYFNNFNYGATSFPDRQSLGDTSNFLLIGSDRYSTSSLNLVGSDIAWISKPPAGSTCPIQSTFSSGVQALKNSDGSFPYSPVPAKQTDPFNYGWVAATPNWYNANSLSIYKVTNKAGAVAIGPVQNLSVPNYSQPPSAPQAGKTLTGQPAPNLETRIYLTQVYSGIDPRVGHQVLWTAHTVAGGIASAGSEVRWYEINPNSVSLDQMGTVAVPSQYVYNGTIAPDRSITGSNRRFGSNFVITVNASSANSYSGAWVVSKKGSLPQSALVNVKQSAGPNIDFTCFQPSTNYCRWGDYSGSAPNPVSSIATNGQVWITNEWNLPSTNDSNVTWQTENALINP